MRSVGGVVFQDRARLQYAIAKRFIKRASRHCHTRFLLVSRISGSPPERYTASGSLSRTRDSKAGVCQQLDWASRPRRSSILTHFGLEGFHCLDLWGNKRALDIQPRLIPLATHAHASSSFRPYAFTPDTHFFWQSSRILKS